ncbi:MAG: hypothetical protein K0R82_2471 [Flavipsychrobacter sp.]|jgi:hypothetical protein|nr:hypothetical protein [Flavipsychrobacter sp.]
MIKRFTTGVFTVLFPLALTAQDALIDEEAIVLNSAESAFYIGQEDPPPAMPGGIYKINKKVDIPVTAVGAAWSLYAFTKIYNKDQTPLAEVQALDKNDINSFDRWAAGNYNEAADNSSDLLFYGSMPLPLALLADREIRQDAAKVGFLYLEAMAITGLLYTGSTYFTNRFRPEAYSDNIPDQDKTNGGMRNSFFAGHVALVGTATFFTAKVYSDYHPGSTLSYVLYGGAAAATATTIYLRHIAGKHFPSDLIIGTAVGVASGILVPHFHKNKVTGNEALRLSPFIGDKTYGLTLNYNIR